MNVDEMRKLIEGLPADLKFFTIVGDHEAKEIGFSDWFVTESKPPTYRGTWNGEFFEDDCLIDGEVKVRALVSDN